MTNLQAACGVGQLEHIDEYLKTKNWMAAEYAKRLLDINGLRLPITKSWASNVYWMYAVLLEDDFPMSRDAFRAALKEKGIDTRDFFYSCAQQPVVQEMFPSTETFPVTEKIAQRGFYLPSGLALTEEQVEYVCTSIHDIVA
jgi:perosamine synthetase